MSLGYMIGVRGVMHNSNVNYSPEVVTCRSMEKEDILSAIQKSWVHSHRDDTQTETVYRPEGDPALGLSRDRSGFKLRPDNKLVEVNIAPTDGTLESVGSWDLIGNDDDELTLHLRPNSTNGRVLKIVSIEPDCLRVRK